MIDFSVTRNLRGSADDQFDTEHFSLFAGKFNPAFGLGFDLAPGIYGEDHPEDYELTERIGFGGSVTFADETLARQR